MRLNNKDIKISEEKVKDFFKVRAQKFEETKPYVSMLYQDKNESLAIERNEYEIKTILPKLSLNKELTKVLDVGCGIGRWGDALKGKIKQYDGTDFSEDLLEIARARFNDEKSFDFYEIPAQSLNELEGKKYNLIIMAGVLHYINTEDIKGIFKNFEQTLEHQGEIYIRLPIALENDLVLLDEWSEELADNYNAIYRNVDFYMEIFDEVFTSIQVVEQSMLYPENLNNRKETAQYYFILKKVK